MLDRLLALRRVLTSWYVVAPVAAIVGLALGAMVFIYATPGKPNIGVIDLPFIVITDDTAFIISEFINYARRDDSIKAVVLKMSTPGGGAAASERLYIETRNLREEKPVVLVMNGMVASGGYMAAMGANHIVAQSSSLVGNVGVITFAGPFVPRIPPESIVFTGPHKLSGSSRRDWLRLADQLKDSFAQMVISERGDRLRITEEELVEGRLYTGVDAVRLGLADEIGGDSDAFEKAAELAGISNYGLVDVNAEVQRQFILRIRRILASEYDGAGQGAVDALSLLLMDREEGNSLLGTSASESDSDLAEIQALRKLMLAGSLDIGQEDPLPEFPLEIGRPNFYYLYTGHDN
jgi:protease-4